jgi:16S rRNA (adenine1518-N6/adenine1519-N6)-dimethyltransferase
VGRRLGQHFLTDITILDRIVAALNPVADDVVLEIGPGEGSLTRRLASRVGRVVAIEKDEALIEEKRKEKGERRKEKGKESDERGIWPENVSLVVGDALRLDWHAEMRKAFLLSPFSFLPFKVIGNIPYYITTPLIEKALTPPLPSVVVFLMQREVADRLAAPPGSKTYGALSVGVQAVANVERLFTVKAGAFRPPPKVDSAVVRLTPRASPAVEEGERPAFRAFTAQLFSQRRKQLVRSLRDAAGLDKAGAERLLAAAGIDATARPEVLASEQLVTLFRTTLR